jgi:hypothetical protein
LTIAASDRKKNDSISNLKDVETIWIYGSSPLWLEKWLLRAGTPTRALRPPGAHRDSRGPAFKCLISKYLMGLKSPIRVVAPGSGFTFNPTT